MSSTSSLSEDQKKALAYVRQAMAFHHAFQWVDALRSINMALKLDSELLRAHTWGIIVLRNIQGSETEQDQLIAKAKSLLERYPGVYKGSNSREFLWYKFAVNNDVGALQSLAVDHDDIEAQVILSWDFLQDEAPLLKVLQEHPKHAGALHYMVHFTENSGRYEQAISNADRLVKAAETPPHYIHMYGHILPLVGRWDEAVELFKKSHCIHLQMIGRNASGCKKSPLSSESNQDATYTPKASDYWHFNHNLELLGFSLSRTGRADEARSAFEEKCLISPRSQMKNCTGLVVFELASGNYEQALEVIDKKQRQYIIGMDSYDYVVSQALEVEALLMLGRIDHAREVYNRISYSGLPISEAVKTYGSRTRREVLALQVVYEVVTSGRLQPSTERAFKTMLELFTESPNFDIWTHGLPILQRIYRAAQRAQVDEVREATKAAIQDIDPEFPIE